MYRCAFLMLRVLKMGSNILYFSVQIPLECTCTAVFLPKFPDASLFLGKADASLCILKLSLHRHECLNLVYLVNLFNIIVNSEYCRSEPQPVAKIQKNAVLHRKYGGYIEGTLPSGLSFGLQNPPSGAHLAWKTVVILARGAMCPWTRPLYPSNPT